MKIDPVTGFLIYRLPIRVLRETDVECGMGAKWFTPKQEPKRKKLFGIF